MLNGIGKDSQDFSSHFERSDTFLNSSLQSEVLSVLDFRLQLTSLNIGCTRDSCSKLRSPLIGTIFRDSKRASSPLICTKVRAHFDWDYCLRFL